MRERLGVTSSCELFSCICTRGSRTTGITPRNASTAIAALFAAAGLRFTRGVVIGATAIDATLALLSVSCTTPRLMLTARAELVIVAAVIVKLGVATTARAELATTAGVIVTRLICPVPSAGALVLTSANDRVTKLGTLSARADAVTVAALSATICTACTAGARRATCAAVSDTDGVATSGLADVLAAAGASATIGVSVRGAACSDVAAAVRLTPPGIERPRDGAETTAIAGLKVVDGVAVSWRADEATPAGVRVTAAETKP